MMIRTVGTMLCAALASAACNGDDDGWDESPGTGADGGAGIVIPSVTFRKDGAMVDLTGVHDTSAYKMKEQRRHMLVAMGDPGEPSIRIDVAAPVEREVSMGTYDCSLRHGDLDLPIATLSFVDADHVWAAAPGKPCTVTIKKIGQLGGRMKGTFAATLVREGGDGPDLLMTEGTFDVRRRNW